MSDKNLFIDVYGLAMKDVTTGESSLFEFTGEGLLGFMCEIAEKENDIADSGISLAYSVATEESYLEKGPLE